MPTAPTPGDDYDARGRLRRTTDPLSPLIDVTYYDAEGRCLGSATIPCDQFGTSRPPDPGEPDGPDEPHVVG